MQRSRDCDHVVSRGTLHDGSTCVDYYTTVPTPTQWIAVGVLKECDDQGTSYRPRRMIVGAGSDEAQAISDLTSRFLRSVRSATAERDALLRQRPDEKILGENPKQRPITPDHASPEGLEQSSASS